ncbi:MAG: class I SAM-dependent RNA methyltransferase [Chloroflexota bacterium]|nr:MAG: class I SAM-dependent RNA methyltransferase [Chloroflexota bacterium]
MPEKTNPPIPELIELELTSIAYGGAAVGRLDGVVAFVDGGLPGELVVARVYLRKPQFIKARVIEVRRASPLRIAAPCPYFGDCGGCQWQHLQYAEQAALKRQTVVEQLQRLGGFPEPPVLPTLAAVEPWQYRNNARFSTRKREGTLGFTRGGSHFVLPIDHCLIAQPRINDVLRELQGRGRGLHQVVVRYGARTGQLLVNPRFEGVSFETGQQSYEEELLGQRYRVAAPSFFQVNTRPQIQDIAPGGPHFPKGLVGDFSQAELLALLVLERLAPQGDEHVVDAYCGVGTFALLLAKRAARVVGIEEAPSAIRDAQAMSADLSNVEFIQGKTEAVLPELEGRVDAVVLDPARVGCHPDVIAALLSLRPARLVYVSCDPSTLARDLALLRDGGYHLEEVIPVDMFPQTFHIETVSTLRLE